MPEAGTLDELQLLVRATAPARGAALLPSLAQYIAQALNATESLISSAIDQGHVRTLAVFAQGASRPNYEYALADAPCQAVIAGEIVHHESDFAQKYPRAANGRQGYYGVPLAAADGAVLGHLCVYSAGRLPLTQRQRLLCAIVAGRAAAELQRLRAAGELERLQAQQRYLQGEIKSIHNFEQIIGASAAWVRVLENMRRVAPTDATVLISGERGTGKELIARAIHSASSRADRPFIKLDCAALSVEDLSGDAPTSLLGLADGGTLFLDEIGGLKLSTQSSLLRVLLERESGRLGSDNSATLNLRIVASTNRDLPKLVRDGQFREDLYHRLNVFPVELPPLRAHAEDIPQLVRYFVQKYATQTGRRVDGVDPDTLAALTRYPWPGNVRELEHLVERALNLNTSPQLKIPPEMLALHTPSERADVAAAGTGTGTHRTLTAAGATLAELDDLENTGLHHVQREHILRVLNATHWVIEGNSGAALKLGMKPATLRHRMKKLGIARAGSLVVQASDGSPGRGIS
jgi:transcriptional regulator with GAF, ATPase, and Fis domain